MFGIFNGPNREQVVAFAGLMQSAMLVHQLASRDSHDQEALKSSCLSVLRVDAVSAVDVYGSLGGVSMGGGVVDQIFGGKLGAASREVFQYAVAMHQHGLKLKSSYGVGEIIHERVEELSRLYLTSLDAEPDGADDDSIEEQIYEDIAELYTKTISLLSPRIMVRGSQGRLEQPRTVNRVRSTLLAGIRAGFLWDQLGGRRWHLMLHRNQYQSIGRRIARA